MTFGLIYLMPTSGTVTPRRFSLPFPVFVATAYDSRNNKEFFPIENTLLYSGVPLDPRKLDKNAFMGGGFVQVSYLSLVVYSI